MRHKTKNLLFIFSGIIVLGLLILYMGGFFASGLIGQQDKLQESKQDIEPEQTTRAQRIKIPQYYQAVGTISPKTKTRIESQIRAKIKSIQVRPGQSVQRGKLLIEFDNRSFFSRLEQARQGLKIARSRKDQARQGLNRAKADFDQAEAAYKRVKTYYESEAATEKDMEEAKSAFLQARAGLKKARAALKQAESGVGQAEEKVQEAQILLSYTQIKAPISAQVGRRMADPGDLAMPGKVLLTLQTGKTLRLEALVREKSINSIKTGQELLVNIPSLPRRLKGIVDELVPVADPVTRTFVVKVSLPESQGLLPGMFAYLQVPVAEQEVVLADQKAILSMGQLKMVRLKTRDKWQDVFVLTGQRYKDQIEILSGLQGGETLALFGAGHE